MSAPRILFGVGATKAGTSWLHEWLSSHPDCHLRPVKEVHFFDTLEGDGVSARIRALEAERLAVTARGGAPARIDALSDCISLFERADAPGAYLEYLTKGRGREAVVGDVTPAYGLLPVDRLRAMAALGETRFVYILRDPVARLWSHIRMIARRREPDGSLTAERAARILKRTIRGDEDHIVHRSDYDGALQRLATAIPEAQRLTLIFEDLFATDTAPARICDFLGIGPHPKLLRPVHEGPPLAMTDTQYQTARDWLAPQYEAVQAHLGQMPKAWAT